ncbi:MAG: hypothetical protein WC099_01430 [Candidatus Paceibacterota bacterium]
MKNLWQESKYIDLWSLNHFLFGASLAGLAWYSKINFIFAVFLSVLAFVIWEFIEYYTKVGESQINQMSDILMASIGFFIFYFIQTPFLLLVVITIFLILETWGYLHKFIEKQGESPKYMPIICIIAAFVYVISYALGILL